MENDLIVFKEERLGVDVPAELKEKLRDYAQHNNVTMSKAVRIILANVLSNDLQKQQVTSKVKEKQTA